jgi:hypothetical protein
LDLRDFSHRDAAAAVLKGRCEGAIKVIMQMRLQGCGTAGGTAMMKFSTPLEFNIRLKREEEVLGSETSSFSPPAAR